MTRLVFGGDDVTTRGSSGTAILAATGQTIRVYLDAAGTIPADISLTLSGSSIAGSTLTADAFSRIPLFYGPPDGTDTLYVTVNGGPLTAIYARPDDRIDTANAAIATKAALTQVVIVGSNAWLKLFGGDPDSIISGAITRDANGAATSAPVVWPDGSPGTYTADAVSTAFPGAVDAWHITYGSPVTKTVTQPAVTRDSTNGTVTNRPAMTVS